MDGAGSSWMEHVNVHVHMNIVWLRQAATLSLSVDHCGQT